MMKSFFVKQIREESIVREKIPHKSGVYKWWCKLDCLMFLLRKLDLSEECIADIEKDSNKSVSFYDSLNGFTEKRVGEYYCIYVGDTKDLRSRIIKNHLQGNVKTSTFRKTIAAVCFGWNDTKGINEIEDQMILDVFCDKDYACDYHSFQNELINRYFRVLNNDDILPNNAFYSEERHYKTTRTGNGKRSFVISKKRKALGLK